jgi:lysyl-tRNA synthetase class 2
MMGGAFTLTNLEDDRNEHVACHRYVDLIVTEGVRETLRARARMMGALRRTLEARGFLEVETPVLEALAGGADARPFTTFHNALQQPYVLRIATGEAARLVCNGGCVHTVESF